jgi:unsaturated chondroitin disaccharide hydrolase
MVDEASLRRKSDLTFEFASRQLMRLVGNQPGFFPTFTEQGKWRPQVPGWTNWCEGFLAGTLWLVHMQTGDSWFRQQAERYCKLIEPRKQDRQVHDLGFLFWPSWKRWYDLTGDPAIQQVVIQAGRTLALRFQEKGGYLCSFEGPQSLYIDIMMNVGIVFYAAQQTEDPELWRIANQHCLTTRRYLQRGDGSVAHEGIFDLDSGRFLRQQTRQGWRDDSSWARGLTWAMDGFSIAYSYTGDGRFLSSAQAAADFYIERTPPHGIPLNDWEEPNPRYLYESSAAAVAACGLLRLSRLVKDRERAQSYRQYAIRILDTLTEAEFLATGAPDWEGILKHGIYHLPKGVGVDESLIWGDYYLLEGLWLALQTA